MIRSLLAAAVTGGLATYAVTTDTGYSGPSSAKLIGLEKEEPTWKARPASATSGSHANRLLKDDEIKSNIAAYLHFKGWKCGKVYTASERTTNRQGLRSFHLGCMEKATSGSGHDMRGYIVTLKESVWMAAVRNRSFTPSDRALISSAPVPGF